MRKSMNVSFYIKKTKLNKYGKAPVYCRITVNGVRSEFSVNRSIESNSWDSKRNRSNGRKPSDKELNNYLRSIEFRIFEIQRELIEYGKNVTSQKLKNHFLGNSEDHKKLLSLIGEHIENMSQLVLAKERSDSTLRKFITLRNHFSEFLKEKGMSDILVKELDIAMIDSFEHFLKVKKEISQNTTMKYLKALKKITNEALRYGWIKVDPFSGKPLTQKFNKRSYLTSEELSAIAELSLENERLSKVKNAFLFSCYTGLSYADIESLTSQNIQMHIKGYRRIITTRKKTKQEVSIPMLPIVEEIVAKYADHPSMKLIPLPSNQKTNVYLKEIAALAGISKNLTFHMARHTFATTVALQNGVPIESISSLLGHSKMATTQIYAKTLGEKVDSDLLGIASKVS